MTHGVSAVTDNAPQKHKRGKFKKREERTVHFVHRHILHRWLKTKTKSCLETKLTFDPNGKNLFKKKNSFLTHPKNVIKNFNVESCIKHHCLRKSIWSKIVPGNCAVTYWLESFAFSSQIRAGCCAKINGWMTFPPSVSQNI